MLGRMYKILFKKMNRNVGKVLRILYINSTEQYNIHS